MAERRDGGMWPAEQRIRARPLKRMEPGRVCAGDDCQTLLSIYNHDEYCSVCQRRWATRVAGVRRSLDQVTQ